MEFKEIPLGSELDKPYVDFMNKYRGRPTNPKAHHWQFSYIPEKSVITAIVEERDIIGSQCMMPMELLTPKGNILTSKSENSYLRENIRGKSHFFELFSFAEKICNKLESKLIWGFTYTALKPLTRLGFTTYYDCFIDFVTFIQFPSTKRYFANREGISQLKGIITYSLLFLSVPFLNFRLLWQKRKYAVEEKMRNSSDIEELQKEIRNKYPSIILINNSSAYLKWRLDENPNIDFDSKFFYLNDKLIGYCFYSNEKGDVQIRSLVYSDPEHIQPILLELIRLLRKENVYSVLFQGNYENELNKAVFNSLKKLNFRTIPTSGMPFIYKFFDENEGREVKESDWYINNLWLQGY